MHGCNSISVPSQHGTCSQWVLPERTNIIRMPFTVSVPVETGGTQPCVALAELYTVGFAYAQSSSL